MKSATISSTQAGKIYEDYLNNQPIEVTLRSRKCTVSLKSTKLHYTPDRLYTLTARTVKDPRKFIGSPDMPVHKIKCTRKYLLIKAGMHKFVVDIHDHGPIADRPNLFATGGPLEHQAIDPAILLKGAREVLFAKAKLSESTTELKRYNTCLEFVESAISVLEKMDDEE